MVNTHYHNIDIAFLVNHVPGTYAYTLSPVSQLFGEHFLAYFCTTYFSTIFLKPLNDWDILTPRTAAPLYKSNLGYNDNTKPHVDQVTRVALLKRVQNVTCSLNVCLVLEPCQELNKGPARILVD